MRTILCRRGKGEEALARMRELMAKLKLTVNRCHSLGGRPRSGRRSCQKRRALAHSHRSAGSCGSIEPTRFSRRHPLEPRRGNRSLLRGTSRWSTRSLPRAAHECKELNVACWPFSATKWPDVLSRREQTWRPIRRRPFLTRSGKKQPGSICRSLPSDRRY
jgi:hypothetical protein